MNKALSFESCASVSPANASPPVARQRRSRFSLALDGARNTVGHWGKALAEGIAEARRMSQLYDELVGMTDRELAELGIGRADISAVIAGRYAKGQHVADPNLNGRQKLSPPPGVSDQPSSEQGAFS
ncbi:MAG: hypothetical protein RO009_03800 [Pseudorhodoplanes sp.]|nr:hypothetical protein [Pseudorhodoplanes sp.]